MEIIVGNPGITTANNPGYTPDSAIYDIIV